MQAAGRGSPGSGWSHGLDSAELQLLLPALVRGADVVVQRSSFVETSVYQQRMRSSVAAAAVKYQSACGFEGRSGTCSQVAGSAVVLSGAEPVVIASVLEVLFVATGQAELVAVAAAAVVGQPGPGPVLEPELAQPAAAVEYTFVAPVAAAVGAASPVPAFA